MSLKIELLENGILPKRQTSGSAAIDLFAPFPLALQAGLHKIPLRVKIQLPPNTFGSIRCRSSLAKQDISVEAGVIDEDYRGELKLLLRVRSKALLVPKGHAIAQLIVHPYLKPAIEEASLDETKRGDGSFGSTDYKGNDQ